MRYASTGAVVLSLRFEMADLELNLPLSQNETIRDRAKQSNLFYPLRVTAFKITIPKFLIFRSHDLQGHMTLKTLFCRYI